MRRALALAPLVLLACSRPPAAAPAGPGGGAAADAAPGAGPEPAPVAVEGRAWVLAAASLRREPADAARVPGPGGKPVSNVLTVLMRGEPVTLLAGRGAWARVRASGDEPGWLRRADLLEQATASVATVLQPADVFDRPDLLAASPGRRLAAGSIVLVLRQRPPFAEVNAGAPPDAWVLADRLATGERDVATARLCEKARWLSRAGKADEARQVLALARSAFPGAPLVDVLATELGEPPPSAGAAPSAAASTAAGAPGLSPAAAPAPPPGPPAAAPPG